MKPRIPTATRPRLALAAVVAVVAVYLAFDQLLLLGLSLWVTRYDYGTIELVAFDENGNQLDSAGVLRRWRPSLIVRDHGESPVFGVQYGLGTPRIAVPGDEPVSLELLWNVPGFGKVLVDADGDGRGYRVARGERIAVELAPALAETRVRELHEWVSGHGDGAFVSPDAAAAVTDAAALIARGRDVGDARGRAALALEALGLALRAGEDEVLAEARATIRSDRRGVLKVRVEGSDGRPLTNVAVAAREERPDFLFGVYSDHYDAESVARLHALGANYAVLFMTWERTQPAPGRFSLDDFDRFFALPGVANDAFTVCGHALVWLSNETPPYVQRMRGDADAVLGAVREHVRGVVGHYKNTVGIWEAMNEGHPQWSRLGIDDAGLVRIAAASAEEIRKAAPGAPIMMQVTLPLGEDVALKYYPLIDVVSMGRIGAASTDPYRYLGRLADAGVRYDILGLQIYNGAWVNVAGGVQVPAIDLFRFARILDRYSAFGKPLQIAEIAVGSSDYGTPSESWWHAKADERTQADYLEGVFTLAYGNRNVQGINWWGLDDRYRFVEGGGLFDAADRPKLAARRLAALLDSWRGGGRATTDDAGSAIFAGGAGTYAVTARAGDDRAKARVHVDAGKTTTVTLRVRDTSGQVASARSTAARGQVAP